MESISGLNYIRVSLRTKIGKIAVDAEYILRQQTIYLFRLGTRDQIILKKTLNTPQDTMYSI